MVKGLKTCHVFSWDARPFDIAGDFKSKIVKMSVREAVVLPVMCYSLRFCVPKQVTVLESLV